VRGPVGMTTVSASELKGVAASGAAQAPQNRLVSGFWVAQLGHRGMRCSLPTHNPERPRGDAPA
jgi:hypothetical protein